MAKTNCGHYTTQNGLMGIISSEIIWATNIKFLNDEHEFLHALNLINEIIPTAKITSEYRDHSIFTKYIEDLEKNLKTLDDYVSESIFIISFSEETDLLRQWRGYCPENNGFCIVFDIDKIFESVKLAYDNVHLLTCVYEKENKEKLIKNILNKYWFEYLKNDSEKSRKAVIEQLAKEIMLLASYFKHPSFSEEKEKRIVIILDYAPDSDLKFRCGRFSIIPYIELTAPKESIKEIIIGPTSSKKLSRKALDLFLEKTHGYPAFISRIDIAYSTTPYRQW